VIDICNSPFDCPFFKGSVFKLSEGFEINISFMNLVLGMKKLLLIRWVFLNKPDEIAIDFSSSIWIRMCR
jgi:hypothetical protein